MLRTTKYVCVTGFARSSDPEKVRFPRFADRLVFGGVLMSPKTFHPEGHPKARYPDLGSVQMINLMLRDKGVLPIAHYHLARDIRASDVMVHLEYFQNANFHGVQFNTSNMDLLKVAARYLGALTPIFQINRSTMKGFSGVFDGERESIQAACTFFEALRYMFKTAHVLFDLSGGHGKKIDLGRAMTFLEVMAKDFSNLHPGIAGGLSPENLRSTLGALGVNDVSVDVESKVRSASDELIPDRATAFYNAMAEIDRESTETP